MDFVGLDGITEADMKDYSLPPDEDLEKVTAYWLGQFMPWDSRANAKVAMTHGMEAALPSKANWWSAENLDCSLTGIHDHQMYRKFAFGRLCSQISVDVRNGLISRDEALQIVEDRDGLFPEWYAGVYIEQALDHMGVTREWLTEQLDKHTNWDLFSHVVGNRPILKEWHREAAE
jgi:hypothetical protein